MRKSILVLVAALLGPGALRAQAPKEEPRFGLHLYGVAPTSQLHDYLGDKLGVGLGVHMTFDLGRGHVLRPRADYLTFGRGSRVLAGGTPQDNEVSGLGAGLDYLYFLDGGTQGLYLTGGLSVTRWTLHSTPPILNHTDVSTKPGAAVGVGYNFNRSLGAELRYTYGTSAQKNSTLVAPKNIGGLEVGMTYRF